MALFSERAGCYRCFVLLKLSDLCFCRIDFSINNIEAHTKLT